MINKSSFAVLFYLCQRNGKLSEKMEYVPTIVCVGSIIGLLIGGRFGARIGGRNYIESNQLTVYKSKTHAEVSNLLIRSWRFLSV